MRPILVASNVLISQAGELLMGLRSDNMKWETPGGKIEGELLVDGARREQREETGMELLGEPVLMDFFDGWPCDGIYGRPWYVVVFFLWKTWEGFPQLCEGKHLQWRWFKQDELPQPECCTFGSRDFLRRILPAHLECR